MAAGIGSRFGGGIKQLAPVGLNGEIIMDYSIHDAIEAGFNKIVFIIRKDIKDAFKEAIGDRIEKICKDLDVEIAYAYQELNELPEGVELPAGRTKPWGTGQAVLACKKVLHEPFAVMLPFTFLLMWTAKEKLLKAKGRQICFTNILWYSTKVAFLFSLTIEFLQLFLRLGTFQLSDLCYNTLGGAIGGVLYWMGWKVKK